MELSEALHRRQHINDKIVTLAQENLLGAVELKRLGAPQKEWFYHAYESLALLGKAKVPLTEEDSSVLCNTAYTNRAIYPLPCWPSGLSVS